MSQVGNNENSVGGQYLIQDRDHMVESKQPSSKAKAGRVRQVDQAQSGVRQHGGDHRVTRQQGDGGRQSH